MTTLTIHPKNKEQLSVFKAIADALNVSYEEGTNSLLDETAYLNSTEANRKALDKSIKQIENGQTINITLADLWK